MDDTRRRERQIAIATVLAVHLLLGWLLLRVGAVALPFADAVDDDALQVTWITPSPITDPVPLQRASAPRRAASAPRPAPTPRVAPPDAGAAPTPDSATDVVSGQSATLPPDSAMLLEQGLQSIRRPPTARDFERSPLQDRRANLAGQPAGRFAMRREITPAVVVESIGRLFGGGPSDPCPRLRDNIADLAPRGDSAALQDAMAQRAAHCP